MLDWECKVLTDQGSMQIKNIATKYADKRSSDYHMRWFTSEIKTDRRYAAQIRNFRIETTKNMMIQNERGDWKKLEYLYFHSSSEFTFSLHFFASNLRSTGALSNEFSIRCLPRQKFLMFGDNKLVWKKFSDFGPIGKEYIKMHNDALNHAEYMGCVKKNRRTQMVSIKLEDSLGVRLEPGIVALSDT